MSTAWDALTRLGQALAVRGEQSDLHRQLVEIIRAATNCDAIALTRLNPISDLHETSCNLGYSESVMNHLNNWFIKHDEVYHHMRTRDRNPLRWKDMPFAYAGMYSAAQVFRPAGYREGVTVCLYNDRGDYTGALHLSSSDSERIGDDAMKLLTAAQTIVGTSADWWSEIYSTPRGKATSAVRVAVTASGNYRCIFSDEENTFGLFRSHIAPLLPVSFSGFPERVFFVRGKDTLSIRSRRSSDIVILDVCCEPIPRDLTSRELDVSSLLIRGMTNSQIAQRLNISNKTVSHHVESLLQKLHCRNRTEVAIVGERLGLYSLRVASNKLLNP